MAAPRGGIEDLKPEDEPRSRSSAPGAGCCGGIASLAGEAEGTGEEVLRERSEMRIIEE